MSRKALVVCSDSRALELAKVLATGFTVHSRQSHKSAWTWQIYADEGWQPVKPEDQPTSSDVLFFHTGDGDPKGVPDNMPFRAEFAFSGAGLRLSTLGGRPQALPIHRRFEAGYCPIKPHHIDELQRYIDGQRLEPPSFCREETPLPALVGIAVLCQTYLAAAMVSGDLPQDGPAANAIGWSALPDDVRLKLHSRLSAWWATVQLPAWWRQSVGAVDDRALRGLLLQLVEDLDSAAELKGYVSQSDKLSDASPDVQELLSFLMELTRSDAIARLLSARAVSSALVVAAYEQVQAALNRA